MVKNSRVFFNSFWYTLTDFLQIKSRGTSFDFAKCVFLSIFKRFFLFFFSLACSVATISSSSIMLNLTHAEYDVPFIVFVIIFIISYFFSEFIWVQISKLGRRNIFFHAFYVLFVLNIVNLIMYYNLFHVSTSAYFLVSFVYLVISAFWSFFRSKTFKLVFILLSVYSLIVVFLNFDFSLIFSNSTVYRKTRWDPFFVHFSKRLTRFMRHPPIRRSVRLFYKNFSDSTLVWDYSIFLYVCLYVTLSIIFFFISVILYYKFLVNFSYVNSGSYFLYPFFSICFSAFIIYLLWSFLHYFNGFIFGYVFSQIYTISSYYSMYAYYMTYLMSMVYLVIIFFLFSFWFALFRRFVHRIANRSYITDLDYKSIKNIVYGTKKVPLFWKFPRSWVKKGSHVKLIKPRKSKTLNLPDDAEFYYGGPNPSRVLFNHYTGEVVPIFIRDLILENYRIYYKLRRFGVQKPPTSRFANREVGWLVELFKEDGKEFFSWLFGKVSGPFYFYPRSNIEFDYKVNQRLTYEDIDKRFEHNKELGESREDHMDEDEDEDGDKGGQTGEFFDRHSWESLWFQDFAKRLPASTSENFSNFLNPSFCEPISFDDLDRLKSVDRDAHFNALISSGRRLSRQSLALEQTVGLLPNSKYFGSSNLNFKKLSQSDFELVLSVGVQNLVFRESYNEFSDFRSQIYSLTSLVWKWFTERAGRASLYLIKFNFTWYERFLDLNPRLAHIYKLNAQSLFFNSIVRLISFGFVKALNLNKEISSTFFKFWHIKYFWSKFTNFTVSAKHNVEFGFLTQLMRFGFGGGDLRPYYSSKETPFNFIEDWGSFSLNSSYCKNIQFFSSFPFFSYLPDWEVEFSGFFEHPGTERYIDMKYGRYGRFRFVNSRIILENETSEKIYNYFINLKTWLHGSNGINLNTKDFLLLFKFHRYSKLFALGKYKYSKYFANYFLVRCAFQLYRINRLKVCSPNSYKQGLINRVEEDFPSNLLRFSPEDRAYGNLSLGSAEYSFLLNSSSYLHEARRLGRGLSSYGFSIPTAYIYSTTSNFYVTSQFISSTYTQFSSSIAARRYGKDFIFSNLLKNQARVPTFFSIFDRRFNNSFFHFQSLDMSLFNNFRANFLVNLGSKIYAKYRKNANIKFLDFYNCDLCSNYFDYSLLANYMGVAGSYGGYFQFFHFNRLRSKRLYNFILPYKFFWATQTSRKFSSPTQKYIRRYRWLHNWSIKFIWSVSKLDRYEHYSFKRHSHINYSFFDRAEIDFIMKSSLGGTVFPFFLFGFLSSRDLDRVFHKLKNSLIS